MELSKLIILNEDEIMTIDRASKEILSEVGIRIKSKEVLRLLEQNGLKVDHDRCIVKFDPAIVEEAIASTPKDIELYNRDRSYSIRLGNGNPSRFAAGFNSIYMYDSSLSSRRPIRKQEVADFAKISNYLEEIDIVSPEAMPQDVLAKSSVLHALDAVLNNTRKPILFSPENEIEVNALIKMLRVVVDSNKIDDRPIGICQFSPSSPLFWNEGTIKGFIRIAKEGFPCTILPGPLAGATSPYTIASNLIQRNCEVLSGVAIAQLVNKGTPVLVYIGGGQFDMRSLTALLGTPEIALMIIAGTQLAQFYKIPTHACIPCSDSHCLDQQLGIENMMLILIGLLCRTDLMVNAGMFATGETAAFEQLVVDNEIIKMARRIASGFRITKDSLCVDALKRVGPMGNFLTDESTLKHLRNGEWSISDILTREKHDNWQQDGSKTIVEKARKKVENLIKRENVSLEEKVRKELRKIIEEFEEGNGL